MVWRTRDTSRQPGDPTQEGPRIRPHQDFPAGSRPHQTPHHHREKGGDSHAPDPTPQQGKEGGPPRPHTTGGEEGGGVPINPTRAHTTGSRGAEGRLTRPFHLGGRRGERVTIYTCLVVFRFIFSCYIYIHMCIHTCMNTWMKEGARAVREPACRAQGRELPSSSESPSMSAKRP